MRMVAHSYDTYDHAVSAVHALEGADVPHDDISLVSGDKTRSAATGTDGDTSDSAGAGAGTGASVGTVLGGGAGLLAGLGMLAIPGVGPVVAAGWLIATLAGAGVGAAAGATAGGLLGSLTGAGVDEADARSYAEHVGRGGTLVTVRASDAMAPEIEYILEHGHARAKMAAANAAPVIAPASTGAARTTGDTIQVVKEDLVVAKRAVEGAGIRVVTHVVETPVEEQVSLHEERVVVDRRPINRPLTGVAADAFRERTLTATAMREEAVVGKETRVVEEIGLRREASDRVETVHETLRETKVDVEQVPDSAAGEGTMTRAAGEIGGLPDNGTTRAKDGTFDKSVAGEKPVGTP